MPPAPDLATIFARHDKAALAFSFFENVTGETRRDYGVTGQAFLLWAPFDWVSLSGLVDVTQNWSTVDDNDYFAWVASPSVRLTLRF